MRASDADRENIVASLREHTVAGRLDQQEFEERMRAAYAAKTYGDLAHLTRDLPVDLAQSAGGAPGAGPIDLTQYNETPVRANLMRQGPVTGFGGAFVVNVVIWGIVSAAHGGPVYFWPMWLLIPLALSVLRGMRGHDHGDRHAERHRVRAELHRQRHELRGQLRDSHRALRDDIRRQRRGEPY
jgi:hypothetical protein